jgi:hypothetical protein
MTNTLELARAVAREALALAAAVAAAEDAQWSASHTPQPREDTTERSRGGHSDPTLNIVTDDRRLALRDAVTKSETNLERAGRVLRASRAAVEHSLDAWNGAAP